MIAIAGYQPGHASLCNESGIPRCPVCRLAASGHDVFCFDIDTLSLEDGILQASGIPVQSLQKDSPFPTLTKTIIDHSLVWVLGLGDRGTFLDKFQFRTMNRSSLLFNA